MSEPSNGRTVRCVSWKRSYPWGCSAHLQELCVLGLSRVVQHLEALLSDTPYRGRNQVPERRLALPRAVAYICASRAGPKGAQLGTERLPCVLLKAALHLEERMLVSNVHKGILGAGGSPQPLEEDGRDKPPQRLLFLQSASRLCPCQPRMAEGFNGITI